MLTVIPGRGCLVRVWQCLRVAAILHLLMVLVRGVAVGGHYHTVPQGGHDKSGEYQENTLAAPCTLEHNQPSLRQENQELDSRLACIE